MPTTIRDVAQEAGVAISSVSRILRGVDDTFSASTEERVREAAARLGYQANGAARLLRQQKTNLVGVAINTQKSYLNPLVQVAHAALREKGYEPVFLELGQPATQSSFFNLNMLAGVMSADARMMFEVPEFYENLHHQLPIIALYPMPAKSLDCVTTDRRRLIEMAVEHLVALGHHRIAFAENNPPPASTDAWKLEGWKRALKKFPVDRAAHYLIALTPDTDQGQAVVAALTSMRPQPTALICNDRIAFYVMKHLQQAGWKIPHQLSVIGHGRSDYGDLSSPSLTTVLPPLEEVGRIAVERLVQRIEAAAQGKNLPPRQQLIEPGIVVRESTTAPP